MSADMTMRFNVDLDAPLVPRMASTLFVSGDNMANTIEVTLSKGGEPFNADGFSSALKMNRPDGEVVEMTDTTKNHVLTMTMTDDFYAVPGYYTAKVKLINIQTGVRKTVLVLYGEILDDGGTPTIIPGNKLPADIESMLAMMEELREATTDARDAAAAANEAAAGVDAKVAEANAELAGKVSQISEDKADKADADMVYEVTRSANLYDPATMLTDRYFWGLNSDDTSQVELKSNTSYACAIIPITPGKTYTCSGIDYSAFTLSDTESRAKIRTLSKTAPFTFTAEAGERAITLSWSRWTYEPTAYMVVEGDTLPDVFVPYGDVTARIKEGVIIPPHKHNGVEYHVGAGQEYTSFTECLRALADDESEKTIYVHGGTYDVFAEIGGADFCATIAEGTGWRDVSVIVPPNTHIIGLGHVMLEFKPTDEQIGSIAAQLLSPINVCGSCTIENINIDMTSGRYCIHDETSGGYPGARKVFRNVRANRSGATLGKTNAYAGGCGGDNHYYEYDGCVFTSRAGAWSMHNGAATEGADTQIVIKNCAFIAHNNRPAVRLGNVTSNQQNIQVSIVNSHLNTDVQVMDESTGDGILNAFNVTMIGCGEADVQMDSVNNIFTPSVYPI